MSTPFRDPQVVLPSADVELRLGGNTIGIASVTSTRDDHGLDPDGHAVQIARHDPPPAGDP